MDDTNINERRDTMKPAKRTYYTVCEACGAHLDPGEKCDCRKAKEETFPFTGKKGGKEWHLQALKTA